MLKCYNRALEIYTSGQVASLQCHFM